MSENENDKIKENITAVFKQVPYILCSLIYLQMYKVQCFDSSDDKMYYYNFFSFFSLKLY